MRFHRGCLADDRGRGSCMSIMWTVQQWGLVCWGRWWWSIMRDVVHRLKVSLDKNVHWWFAIKKATPPYLRIFWTTQVVVACNFFFLGDGISQRQTRKRHTNFLRVWSHDRMPMDKTLWLAVGWTSAFYFHARWSNSDIYILCRLGLDLLFIGERLDHLVSLTGMACRRRQRHCTHNP
jgi:hypothetical protein